MTLVDAPVEMKPKAAAIVDPYSSGRYLVFELADRGMPIVCIRSSLKLGAFFLSAYDLLKEHYVETIDHEALDATVQQLQALPFEIVAVFAGSEPGVHLAEQLAEALSLPTANGTALLKARKDKYEMQEQLRRCGVPAAAQFLSGNADELVTWARDHGQWPLVAKPTCSSGSDGIFFCKSEEDVVSAQHSLVGTVGPNGNLNGAIVLQEFLDGTEYIVDTVSHAGRHLCCAIWVYTKRKGTPWSPTCIISEGNRLLPPDGDVQDILVDYVFKVLTAVGLKYGPCHTEVMLTARGPILVEVNTRLHGLQGPHLIGLATGTSKAKYAVDVLVDGGKLFGERYLEPPRRFLYPMHKECLQLVLISSVQGYLERGIANAVYHMGLPSVIKVLPAVRKGGFLSQSCDLNTAAGYVLMVHESAEQLEEDRRTIRAAEDQGHLYVVSPEPPAHTPDISPSASPALRATSAPISVPSLHGSRRTSSANTPNSSTPTLSPLGSTSLLHATGSLHMHPVGSHESRPTISPRLQSTEKVEELWAAVNGFSLSADGSAEDDPEN